MGRGHGLEVLGHIKENSLPVKAIMLSSLMQEGSDRTIKALELGAFDFVPKPAASSMDESRDAVGKSLVGVIESFVRQTELKNMFKGDTQRPVASSPQKLDVVKKTAGGSSNIVVIGISTGGPNALQKVIPRLPADLGVPILIVQHMPPKFTKSLADSLNRKSSLEVAEAVDRQVIEPNLVLIAPGGKQMKVEAAAAGEKRITITDDPPENSCKPAVDYLFRSVSQHYGANATSVIMTGMGCDGKIGMKLMKRAGAITIAQEQASCVVYGMPKEVIEAGIVDVVSPLESIAEEICKTIGTQSKVLI